jgi:ketosteroid isomerase-like protein
MSNPESPIQLIERIYAAFAQGDVASITERLTADAEFCFAGGSADVPWHGPWRGAEQIATFFATMGKEVEFQTFEPLGFAAGTDTVAVRLRLRYRIRRTGRSVDEQQVHWWSLRGGKVSALTHFEDTSQVIAASAPHVT